MHWKVGLNIISLNIISRIISNTVTSKQPAILRWESPDLSETTLRVVYALVGGRWRVTLVLYVEPTKTPIHDY